MPTDLEVFLARHEAASESTATWADGSIHLKSALYFTSDLPALDSVTSARGIVFRGHSVLAFRNRWGTHILPGGRREPGETVQETLAREVLEECGWRIARETRLIAVQHFCHLTPKPAGYAYPYPHFVWLISLAEAVEPVSDARINDDEGIIEASFLPITEAVTLALSSEERLLLKQAIRERAGIE